MRLKIDLFSDCQPWLVWSLDSIRPATSFHSREFKLQFSLRFHARPVQHRYHGLLVLDAKTRNSKGHEFRQPKHVGRSWDLQGHDWRHHAICQNWVSGSHEQLQSKCWFFLWSLYLILVYFPTTGACWNISVKVQKTLPLSQKHLFSKVTFK